MKGWSSYLVALGLLAAHAGWSATANQQFFVSPAGRDFWSGRLPEPNQGQSDGPFASIARARDAIRAMKAGGPTTGPITVRIRGGRYFFDRPITFGPEDSGTEEGPISYLAFPGETPELIGGCQLTAYTSPGPRGAVEFKLPPSETGPWRFRSLFVDGRREVRARYPNIDATDPFRKGFLYAATNPQLLAFGIVVGGIHNAGDWLDYRVSIPVAGDYTLWIHYGAQNAPYGLTSMDGRSVVVVDGRGCMPLTDLIDTGAWSPARWARSATLRLSAGEHVLRWQNQKGGGLVLDVLALCDNPGWIPAGSKLSPLEHGHLVGFSAKDFIRSHGRQIMAGGAGEGPRDAIWCGPNDFREAWLAAPDAEIHIFQSGDCRAFKEILSIKGYDPKTRRLLLEGPEARSSLNPGDRYFVENVKEELDAPGEWFLDSRAGTLIYIARRGFSAQSEVIVPMTNHLIQVMGHRSTRMPVRHLRFAGLTFRDTDWARGGASSGYGVGDEGAVYLYQAEACVVEDCRFLNLGSYAVCVAKGRGNSVRACDVAHAGGGGVLILESSGNLVTENHIHHLGEAYKHVGGIVLVGAGASDNTLSHNAIHDSARYGISMKNPGRHNVVEFNLIKNTNLETSDSGGIEVTQLDREFRSGSVIRNNVVADTIGYSSAFGEPTYMSWGIYLDSFASGYLVSGNLVYRTWNGGIMLQGGRENRVVNNIFVDGQVAQGSFANFEHHSTDLQVTNNIFAFTTSGAVAFMTGILEPEVLRIDRNLYFPPRGATPAFGSGGTVSLDNWRRQGRDVSSMVANPQFRRPGVDDYSLLPGSPAFKLGFQALPLGKVGPRVRKCTCKVPPAGRLLWGGRSSGGD